MGSTNALSGCASLCSLLFPRRADEFFTQLVDTSPSLVVFAQFCVRCAGEGHVFKGFGLLSDEFEELNFEPLQIFSFHDGPRKECENVIRSVRFNTISAFA